MITAVMTQFKQLRVEKVRSSTGFEPLTTRYRCDALTNLAIKLLTSGAGHLWVTKKPVRNGCEVMYGVTGVRGGIGASAR